jgi:Protein of unknown function (DUF3619)
MDRTISTKEQLEARFALKVAAGLREAAEKTPHDINERLKAARFQALAARKQTVSAPQTATSVNVSRSGGAASMSLGGPSGSRSWFYRLSYLLPALALSVGVWTVMQALQVNEVSAFAEIDAEVLADELPPVAFLESGFSAFAKNEVTEDGNVTVSR